jgi:20S proteasome alpha/beta subunit
MSTRPRLNECFPQQLGKPYIRPDCRETKAVTIAVGLKCLDGIVLAADEQISARGWHKYEEQKLLIIESGSAETILAYSGLPTLAKEAEEKLTIRLNEIDDPFARDSLRLKDARECIEKTLVELAQQHFNQTDDLSLLVACSCQLDSPELWIFNAAGFHTVYEFEVIGAGDSSVVRYLEQLYRSGDTVDFGEKLAMFLVEKAKKHVDGCGGETDIISIPNTGHWRLLKRPEIHAQVGKMEEREKSLLRKIISG